MNDNTSDLPQNTAIWQPIDNVDKFCFACGHLNAHGLHMKFESDRESLRSTLTLQPHFRGWSNLIHGGIISTILDETMSWTVLKLARKLMLTKGMEVQFVRPVRVGMTVTVSGRIEEWMSKRKVKVIAELTDESGTLCASSTGEFALFEKAHFLRMGIMPEEDIDAMLAIIS